MPEKTYWIVHLADGTEVMFEAIPWATPTGSLVCSDNNTNSGSLYAPRGIVYSPGFWQWYRVAAEEETPESINDRLLAEWIDRRNAEQEGA